MPVMGPYKSESGKYLLPMHEKVGGEKCAYAASGGRWRDARQEQGEGWRVGGVRVERSCTCPPLFLFRGVGAGNIIPPQGPIMPEVPCVSIPDFVSR